MLGPCVCQNGKLEIVVIGAGQIRAKDGFAMISFSGKTLTRQFVLFVEFNCLLGLCVWDCKWAPNKSGDGNGNGNGSRPSAGPKFGLKEMETL